MVEAEGSKLQGYFCLYMEFEASMVYVIFHLYKKMVGAGEMAHQVKHLLALGEDLGLTPITHMSASIHL